MWYHFKCSVCRTLFVMFQLMVKIVQGRFFYRGDKLFSRGELFFVRRKEGAPHPHLHPRGAIRAVGLGLSMGARRNDCEVHSFLLREKPIKKIYSSLWDNRAVKRFL
eukprot:gene12835-8729_t